LRRASPLVDCYPDVGDPVSAPASYNINEIFDALAALFNGLETGDEIGGVAQTITAYPEVVGDIQLPAMILELDDLNWDLNMQRGADGLVIMATILVQDVETRGAQRALRAFLSADSGIGRVKDTLEASHTLGGLVSYVQMGQARQIGRITYDQVDYMGVSLPLEVVS
jgi:hypothetical protein